MRGLLAALLLVFATTGCGLIQLGGCPGALLQGPLAADGDGGAMVGNTTVIWPDGYKVNPGPPAELYGPFGTRIATEGETVYVGGGENPDGSATWQACGYVDTKAPGG